MNSCDNGKCKEIISGIYCNVKNCEYHREGDKCEAGSIRVGSGTCASCKDTECETFKAKF